MKYVDYADDLVVPVNKPAKQQEAMTSSWTQIKQISCVE